MTEVTDFKYQLWLGITVLFLACLAVGVFIGWYISQPDPLQTTNTITINYVNRTITYYNQTCCNQTCAVQTKPEQVIIADYNTVYNDRNGTMYPEIPTIVPTPPHVCEFPWWCG